jgi:hypothetical protein
MTWGITNKVIKAFDPGIWSSKVVSDPMRNPRPETKGLWEGRYLPPEEGIRSVVSYFLVLQLKSMIAMFRDTVL